METPIFSNQIPTQNTQNEIDYIKIKKLCYHHQQPLILYCDTCNEPICNECQIIGPHNTNYHRILNLQDAYNKRMSYINSQRPLLLNKLNELNSYNTFINNLFEKVTTAKKNIEREVRKDYTALTERIKDIEGKRDTILSYEANQFQNQQNKILDIMNYIKDVQDSKNTELISFLLQYRNVINSINKILEKPIKEKIDLSITENYPNDLEERHRILEDYKRIKNELVKRDESLWKILKEKKDKERENIIKAKEKSQNDIEEWVKLSDRYAQELKKYEVVCSFCGQYLDGKIVNLDCEANEKFYLNFYFTKNEPRESFINSKRHFFGEPVPDLEQRMKQANFLWKKQEEEEEEKRREEEERIQREKEEEERRKKEEEEEERRKKEEEENENNEEEENKNNEEEEKNNNEEEEKNNNEEEEKNNNDEEETKNNEEEENKNNEEEENKNNDEEEKNNNEEEENKNNEEEETKNNEEEENKNNEEEENKNEEEETKKNEEEENKNNEEEENKNNDEEENKNNEEEENKNNEEEENKNEEEKSILSNKNSNSTTKKKNDGEQSISSKDEDIHKKSQTNSDDLNEENEEI